MLPEASVHSLSWIPKTKKAAMGKVKLLPQFLRSVVTNPEWPTKNEQREMCLFTQRQTGSDMKAVEGRIFGCCRDRTCETPRCCLILSTPHAEMKKVSADSRFILTRFRSQRKTKPNKWIYIKLSQEDIRWLVSFTWWVLLNKFFFFCLWH